MYKQFKDINTITFPVYNLPSLDYYIQDKVLFYGDGTVLDDKNMSGKTLGIRRLQCDRSDLFPIARRCNPDIKSLLKSKNKIFIDNNGVIFEYVKTKNYPLVHHFISKVELKDTYSIIIFKNITQRFLVPRPPPETANWARILYNGPFPWIIYDFKENRGQDSFRRA